MTQNTIKLANQCIELEAQVTNESRLNHSLIQLHQSISGFERLKTIFLIRTNIMLGLNINLILHQHPNHESQLYMI